MTERAWSQMGQEEVERVQREIQSVRAGESHLEATGVTREYAIAHWLDKRDEQQVAYDLMDALSEVGEEVEPGGSLAEILGDWTMLSVAWARSQGIIEVEKE
ncbi:MAG: hypothetical protein M3494_07495 [Actinomycetota bacterium]|jgi:hypothetical protein|nr:hypothetical protein [Actinomycetota bacterium]